MAASTIEWTDMSWNPATGCTKISAGCANCYAESMARRLCSMGVKKYKNGFKLTIHPDELFLPYKWRKPKLIFVNSMSDLFHEDMPLTFIKQIFQVMNDCPQHIFQVLTKRAEILKEYSFKLKWTSNIWIGVTIENEHFSKRVDLLKAIPAHTKFLSMEPLLGFVDNIDFSDIDWVIVGGESGPKARPIKASWVEQIRLKCLDSSTAFYFKQWGGFNKKQNGRLLNGVEYHQMPEIKTVLSF